MTRKIIGWTGFAALCALGVAAVIHPVSVGKQPAQLTTATTTIASLAQVRPARAIQTVEVMPVIEVRATRL